MIILTEENTHEGGNQHLEKKQITIPSNIINNIRQVVSKVTDKSLPGYKHAMNLLNSTDDGNPNAIVTGNEAGRMLTRLNKVDKKNDPWTFALYGGDMMLNFLKQELSKQQEQIANNTSLQNTKNNRAPRNSSSKNNGVILTPYN